MEIRVKGWSTDVRNVKMKSLDDSKSSLSRMTDKDNADLPRRYTQGALRLTGRLDVGAKKDESGYTTMFRLYDAEYAKK